MNKVSRFTLPILPSVLVVFFTVLMLWLGFWQLDRAREKEQLLEGMARGKEQSVTYPEDVLEVPRYGFVRLKGRYLTAPQFLLENKVRDKRVGYEVFTPFAVSGWPGVILVNRGWVDAAAWTDDKLLLDDAERTLRLLVDRPPKTGIELGEVTLDGEKPVQKMVYFTPDKIADVIENQSGLPLILPQRVFLLGDEAPDGFARHWKPVIMPPSRHIGYAVQWFGLTVTLWLLYFFWLRAQRRDREKSNPK